MKRKIFLLASCLLLFWTALAVPDETKPEIGVTEWLCNKGYLPKSVCKALAGLDELSRAGGSNRFKNLEKLDPETGETSVLWSCEECWSPAPLPEDRVAVLRADGLWAVPLQGGDPVRLWEKPGLEAIVGPGADGPEQLIIMEEKQNQKKLYLFNVESGQADDLKMEAQDLKNKEKWAFAFQVKDKKVLNATRGKDGVPNAILEFSIGKGGKFTNGTVLLEGKSLPGEKKRFFQPVWAEGGRIIVYGASPI